MSTKQINQLPAASVVNSGDYLIIEQGGITKRATQAQVSVPNLSSPGVIGNGTASASTFTTTTSQINTVENRLVLMGTPTDGRAALWINSNSGSPVPLTGTRQYTIISGLQVSSAATISGTGFYSSVSTVAASFTLPIGINFVANNGSLGAGSTYTQQEGFRAENLTVGGTNIGYRSLVSSGATNWNAYFDGTAKNYFAGLTGFGVVTALFPVDIQGDSAGVGLRIRGRASDDVGYISFWNNSISTEYSKITADASGLYCTTPISSLAGGGTAKAIATGVIYKNSAGVSTVGSSATDLMTYTLPANSLSAAGKGVRVTAWGTTLTNSNTKTVSFFFGSTLMNLTLLTGTSCAWTFSVVILMSSSPTNQRSSVTGFAVDQTSLTPTNTPRVFNTTISTNEANPIIIKCVGTGITNNDISQSGMIVEFIN